jgi:acetate kinase
MMNVLTVNTGSSSVRLDLFTVREGTISSAASRTIKPEAGIPHEHIQSFLAAHGAGQCSAVAHRVVHGGTRFVESCLVDENVLREIEKLSFLAPLHNPPALRWIEACRNAFGTGVPNIAVFDTAFFAAMPDVSKIYALPGGTCAKHGIRRYGFHGIAHRAMLRRWKELRPDLEKGGRLISLQLGSGCSVTAVRKGAPLDTSMGFSPLEGLMMSTRCGDLDPGVLVYLQKSAGFSVDDIDSFLNKSSGLLGVSGVTGDMKQLLSMDDDRAQLAIELYCFRARKYIGSYMAALGGTDGIVFGGGTGENAPRIRAKILGDMQWCGTDLDHTLNSDTIGREGKISASSSSVDVRVIPVHEGEILAQEAVMVLDRVR